MRFLLLLSIFLYINQIQCSLTIQSKINNQKIDKKNSLYKQNEFNVISAAIETKSGSSTVSSSIFNLAKCILGYFFVNIIMK